jgi:hypothetical protein
MVIYDNYTTESGVERAKAYSNQNMMIERDGALYSEADDFAYQQRVYNETNIPIDVEPSPVDEDVVQKPKHLTI